jgi:hypothetical protein
MEQGGCDMQQDHGKKCKGEIEVRIAWLLIRFDGSGLRNG